MPNMYIFICATWNNKECKIMRKDWVTRQHLIITTMIKFPQENMATCLPGGCCTPPWGLSLNHKLILFLFHRLSYTVASLIGFYCLCNNENHTFSVSTGDHVRHPNSSCLHTWNNMQWHTYTLYAQDNTHRSLGGTDTNKHAQLAD